ncbi:MAG: aminotransferase class IV, partial [Flavisolibacter sp.]|nr:aminotransferase class IV [Flavisolibacter sp.]
GILAGITRSKILQLAAEDLKVEETAVSLDEIKNASEVFITSTTKKLLPVASIDGCTIGNGTFPICTLLLSRYEALVK